MSTSGAAERGGYLGSTMRGGLGPWPGWVSRHLLGEIMRPCYPRSQWGGPWRAAAMSREERDGCA